MGMAAYISIFYVLFLPQVTASLTEKNILLSEVVKVFLWVLHFYNLEAKKIAADGVSRQAHGFKKLYEQGLKSHADVWMTLSKTRRSDWLFIPSNKYWTLSDISQY